MKTALLQVRQKILALHLYRLAATVFTSAHDCHFPGSTHKKKLNIFWPKLHCQFHCSPQQSVAPLCRPLTVSSPPPPPQIERQTTTHWGLLMRMFYKGNIYIYFFSYLYSKLWVTVLSAEYLSLAWHASVTNPFIKGALINLLRQFAKVCHFYCRITKSGLQSILGQGHK